MTSFGEERSQTARDGWGRLGTAGDGWGPLGTAGDAGDRWGPLGTVGDPGDGQLEVISTYGKFIMNSLVLMGNSRSAGDRWGCSGSQRNRRNRWGPLHSLAWLVQRSNTHVSDTSERECQSGKQLAEVMTTSQDFVGPRGAASRLVYWMVAASRA